MTTEPEEESNSVIAGRLEQERFRLMGAYAIYQDQIGWSRTQTLVIVEAAVLGGAFSIHNPLSPLLLLLGSVIVFLLNMLIHRDWRIRDYFHDQIKKCGLDLSPPSDCGSARGRIVVEIITWGVIAINCAFALLWSIKLLGCETTLSFLP